MNDDGAPRLYADLADWFHLLTAPTDYAAGAAHALRVFTEALGERPATILELGSGGGKVGFAEARTCGTGYEDEDVGAERFLAVKGNIP